MNRDFIELLEENPVIAAVKDDEGLERCLESDVRVVFLLYGDLMSVSEKIEKIKKADKKVIVHIDLVGGLSGKEISVDFIKEKTDADGIITTKPQLIKRAKELGLYTVMRFFVIDSMAIENMKRQTESVYPDCIEMLPGVMPKVIERICKLVSAPVIAGGLISDKEDVVAALGAGALSVSTTRQEIWFM